MADAGAQDLDTAGLPPLDLRGIYAVKTAALALGLLAGWPIQRWAAPGVDFTPIVGCALLVLLPSLAVAVWRGTPPRLLLYGSFAADVIGLTAAIHYGGGADTVSGPLVYMAWITLAGLVLSEGAAFVVAAASTLAYASMIAATQAGWLAAHPLPADTLAARPILVGLCLVLGAWVTAHAVGRIREVYATAERLRVEATAALSHDLKGPLATIRGYAELLPESSPDEQIELAAGIERASLQATQLVRNVLDAARLDGAAFAPRWQDVDLHDVVTHVFDLYRLAAEASGARLVAFITPEAALVRADPHLLSRAIGNLVSNAIKYGGERATVEVNAVRDGETIRIRVRDNGPGMSEEEQRHLFRKFGRTGATDRVEGTGLGLYIVRRIAEAHHGQVAVRSTPGQGSELELAIDGKAQAAGRRPQASTGFLL